MNPFAEITIFEIAPEKPQYSGAALRGDDVRIVPRIPRDFLQEMLLLSDAAALVLAVLIVFNTTHFPFLVIAGSAGAGDGARARTRGDTRTDPYCTRYT